MSKMKLNLIMGAAALVASSAALTGVANAGATTLYGGGSSLVAPYWRQAADCYGNKTDLIFKAVPPTTVTEADFNYNNKKKPFDCATQQVDPKTTVYYISTGSGTGIAGVYSHDTAKFGDTDPNTGGDQLWPTLEYALSDTPLGATEVGIYNSGGTLQGVTVVGPGQTAGTGQYPNPHDRYGAMVQFPVSIDPVAVSYDPVYKKVRNGDNSVTEYTFNVQGARSDGSGGLKLDADTYCKIFNGQITDWNDPALKALNGGQSLKDSDDPTPDGSWSVPLQIVGRFESSGTTSIFTRHLANVCSSLGGNAFADSASTLPASLQGPHYLKANANDPVGGETAGKFTLADGSDGVAKYLDFTRDPGASAGDSVTQGRLGYVGPDFALPAVLNTNANAFGLNTASLKNSSGNFLAPTAAAASAAYGSLTPPDSDGQGHYDAGSSDPRSRANPQDWVEPASKTSALANPTAAQGYPIVGTTNILTYTCYNSAKRQARMIKFLNWYTANKVVSDPKRGLLASAGLAPLPKTWITAIVETFVQSGTGLNLNINTPGHGGCTAGTITGG